VAIKSMVASILHDIGGSMARQILGSGFLSPGS
jgi:hypothetical protein